MNFLENPVEATKAINEWVEETTEGKISELFKDTLSPETLMVLASTLYFKGTWQGNFVQDDSNTCWQTTLNQLKSATCDEDVEFMTKTSNFFTHTTINNGHKFRVIELPMKESKDGPNHNKFTMLIWKTDHFFTDDVTHDKEVSSQFQFKIVPFIYDKLSLLI